MGFLLGLFIGSTIFILGLVLGGVWGYGLRLQDEEVEEIVEYKMPELKSEQIKVLLDDFGLLVDTVVECYERKMPLQTTVMSNDGIKLDIIYADKTMHIEQCFNMDNEG